ncbi:hypothetical protein SLEP1_g17690 [Rubroshorea leprosula]|uniref:Rab-GAP TBC domain-containing protein n=1 Tax=Rubroshorea leprosula TaxID=152421 RepID=A0AAV5J0Z6_9ROSI|nr:hypothetical protein SLEP1_g17690 [Rubroshorea leprosula]
MLLSLLSRRSLEVDSRDSYGFAVRPQHIQRYREYITIYKEEEDERSEKWKIFLEQHMQSAQPCFSEEEDEATGFKDKTPSEPNKLKEETDAKEEGKVSLLVETTELKEEVSSVEERKETSQTEPIKFKEEVASEEESKEASRTEASELKEEPISETKEEGDASRGKPDSAGSTDYETKKEVQLSEERKTRKVQRRWAQARPSLRSIENMMGLRVKKVENMKDEEVNRSEGCLASIKEAEQSGGESEGEFEEKVCVNEMSDNHANVSKGESDPDVGPQEYFFSWKQELENLVLGGLPKDLRGELWQAFVGVKARRVERYYQDLLAEETADGENNEQTNSAGLARKLRRQIEKDIPRTFPGHPALNEDGRDSLRRLLIAYARHNPSVGYCQAMNFFAGLLLLLMPEENAFWTLVGFLDDYFDGYYTEEMIESQVDQLVFEELMRERFPKLVHHLDYLGVQVAWISGPWFLSIFINMLPWESVLRVWDVLLFEGNRAMLFRTALALMELYGPALITTKDAGDAITLLQSLTGSTFDSSQLVLTACMGFLAVTEARLQELREKHRPSVLVVVEERSKGGRIWKDTKGLAMKLYSFKHDPESLVEEKKAAEGHGDASNLEKRSSSNLDELLSGLNLEIDSLPDLQEQVVWLKVELSRLLEEKRSAILRLAHYLIEQLEQEVSELRQALSDKKQQESAMLKVLMRVEQDQRITEDARRRAEHDAATQRHALKVLQEMYEKATDSIAQMEKRAVMAESMLEATLQYESGQAKALVSPRSFRNQGSSQDSPRKRPGILSFGLGWRDRNKGKTVLEESSDNPNTPRKETRNQEKEP